MVVERVADLSDLDHQAMQSLRLAVYPPEQFANWPGLQLEWSTPIWCVRKHGLDGALLSFVGMYLGNAIANGTPAKIGGIGGVKTHPTARGQGLASTGIRQAIEFFRTQPEIAFALLVCQPPLMGYYAGLGWKEFGGRLLTRQRGEASEFTLCQVMTIGIHGISPTDGVIDLCGPPW